jgi:hypothetical protein
MYIIPSDARAIMSSFDDFLKESKVFDEYDSFTKAEKLEWRKLYQEDKARVLSSAPPGIHRQISFRTFQ